MCFLEGKSLLYIGDYMALGLVTILASFFWDRKMPVSQSGKYYRACLILTAATAVVDIVCGMLLDLPSVPLGVHLVCNSLYFIINVLTTTGIALYMFSKILEHVYDDSCFRRGKCVIKALWAVYLLVIVANAKTGWLFYFDENMAYRRGPLNVFGYIVSILQMLLVLKCFSRHRREVGRHLTRSLQMTCPAIVICIVLQRCYPEIMLNSLIMAMTNLILFLNFQAQRQGKHTLTHLNDRQFFYLEINRRIQSGKRFQVLKISIRDFSTVNQKYGYKVGDEVLYQCAYALENLLPHVPAYHVDATSFALVMDYTTDENANTNLSALIQCADRGVTFKSETIAPHYIIVNCISAESDTNVTDFCEKLEYATRLAKMQKRQYMRCTPALGEEMRHRRYLVERMQHPDREHGFQVWFQPVYCIRTGRFCSMEALLRLVEPDGTMIPPDEFIPVAEQTGLIDNITWFVAEEVCRFLATYGEITACVSINLPMPQLLDGQFEKKLTDIVDRYGIPRHRIGLEVTERALLENFDTNKATMISMSQAGYRFYLDDFGTGYSNFSCLLQLPFSCIKLDRSLLHNIDVDQSALDMLRTLTVLFHNMGHEVIAEGAETFDQVNTLIDSKLDRVQGYYFARPMNQKDLLAFYKDRPCPSNVQDCIS